MNFLVLNLRTVNTILEDFSDAKFASHACEKESKSCKNGGKEMRMHLKNESLLFRAKSRAGESDRLAEEKTEKNPRKARERNANK